MILVDTSVWVSFFSRAPRDSAIRLREMIVSGTEVAVTGLVLQEVLQGRGRGASLRRCGVGSPCRRSFNRGTRC